MFGSYVSPDVQALEREWEILHRYTARIGSCYGSVTP
jgi:hypothetical protein